MVKYSYAFISTSVLGCTKKKFFLNIFLMLTRLSQITDDQLYAVAGIQWHSRKRKKITLPSQNGAFIEYETFGSYISSDSLQWKTIKINGTNTSFLFVLINLFYYRKNLLFNSFSIVSLKLLDYIFSIIYLYIFHFYTADLTLSNWNIAVTLNVIFSGTTGP